MNVRCEYCRCDVPFEDTELRNDKRVCVDVDACDEREAVRHSAYMKDLRKRQRDGDELSEAEKQILGDAG